MGWGGWQEGAFRQPIRPCWGTKTSSSSSLWHSSAVSSLLERFNTVHLFVFFVYPPLLSLSFYILSFLDSFSILRKKKKKEKKRERLPPVVSRANIKEELHDVFIYFFPDCFTSLRFEFTRIILFFSFLSFPQIFFYFFLPKFFFFFEKKKPFPGR